MGCFARRRRARAAHAALGIAFALGCGSGEPAPKPTAAPAGEPAAPVAPAPAAPAAPAPTVEAAAGPARAAEQVFATRCTTCHGPAGRGDGPGAVELVPSPRDFHDPSWQRSVTDAHLAKIVVEGGPAVGKSPMMPPNPDLATQPDVVAELVKKIRGFGGS